MKRILLLLGVFLLLTTCKKDPETGDLLIIFEYDETNQENVTCTLYNSWENFQNYVFLDEQVSDEFGEVFFNELEPGWYYFEGEKVFSSMFAVYYMDSVLVEPLKQTNKKAIMYATKK